LSKAASKAWKWVPIKPGEDAAFAMGMIQWIIDNGRYNSVLYAQRQQSRRRGDAGEVSWTTGALAGEGQGWQTGQVAARQRGRVGVRSPKQADSEGKETERVYHSQPVRPTPSTPSWCSPGEEPAPFDPNSAEDPRAGCNPIAQVTLNGIECKTGLQIIYEATKEHTIAEWAEIAGIRERDILELADEFTRHGNKACVDLHRGVSQHTNGFYNVLAWYTLNCLVGNPDHVGGMIKGTTYDRMGAKAKGTFRPGQDVRLQAGHLWPGHPAHANDLRKKHPVRWLPSPAPLVPPGYGYLPGRRPLDGRYVSLTRSRS
jgi:tetrathionate reductase subunit A